MKFEGDQKYLRCESKAVNYLAPSDLFDMCNIDKVVINKNKIYLSIQYPKGYMSVLELINPHAKITDEDKYNTLIDKLQKDLSNGLVYPDIIETTSRNLISFHIIDEHKENLYMSSYYVVNGYILPLKRATAFLVCEKEGDVE